MSNPSSLTILTILTHAHNGVAGALAMWRNREGTAFVKLVIGDTDYEAKSQGPSAGGYNKMTQALERLARKLEMGDMPWGMSQSPEHFLAYIVTKASHKEA